MKGQDQKDYIHIRLTKIKEASIKIHDMKQTLSVCWRYILKQNGAIHVLNRQLRESIHCHLIPYKYV